MSEPSIPPPPPPPPPAGSPPTTGGQQIAITEWLNSSWAIVKPAWLEYVLAILVFELVLFVAALACYVPALVIAGPMIGGLYVYTAKRACGRQAQISDLFLGFRKFSDAAILYAAIALIPAIVTLIAFIPMILSGSLAAFLPDAVVSILMSLSGLFGCLGCVGIPIFVIAYPIIVGTLFVFAYPLVMFKGLHAIPALKASMAVVKENFFGYLMLLLACGVIVMLSNFLGAIACGVGILVLTPIALAIVFTMQVHAYRQAFGLSESDLDQYES